MSFKAFFAGALISSALSVDAMADSAQSKALVLEALENTLLAGDTDAVETYFEEDYIQHNPMFPDGIDGQKGVVA
ncbi:MAG: hypothetical protein AAGF25_13265, partial [Pseudomonadota bacterium]